MTAVRWGVLSTARIADLLVRACAGSTRASFTAVASRDVDRAAAAARRWGVERAYGSYEELLADDAVDAVYVPLPISLHADWAVRALEAGKHVLVEKPFAATVGEVERAQAAAAAAGRQCVEGLMWRLHPQTVLARRLVADGAVGRVSTVRSALTVSAPRDDIRRRPEVGGGALLDLGTYCLSATRLFGGEPVRVHAEQVPDVEPGPGSWGPRPAARRVAGAERRRAGVVRRRARPGATGLVGGRRDWWGAAGARPVDLP